MAEVSLVMMPSFKAQDLARMLWRSASLNHRNQSFLDRAAVMTLELLADCNPLDVANMLWAFARLEVGDDAAIHALVDLARRRTEEFPPQELANVL